VLTACLGVSVVLNVKDEEDSGNRQAHQCRGDRPGKAAVLEIGVTQDHPQKHPGGKGWQTLRWKQHDSPTTAVRKPGGGGKEGEGKEGGWGGGGDEAGEGFTVRLRGGASNAKILKAMTWLKMQMNEKREERREKTRIALRSKASHRTGSDTRSSSAGPPQHLGS